MQERTVERGDARLTYDVLGRGTPLVLVQGLGMPGLVWRGLAKNLAQDDFRVVLPDNRGTGRSSRTAPPYTTDLLAQDLACVLEDACDGPAIVVGVSLGGMIAQRLALTRPELVSGLVLASTTCGLPVARPPAPSILASLVRLGLMRSRVSLEELGALLTHPDSHEIVGPLLEGWAEVFETHPTPMSTYLAQLSAAAHHNTGFELGRIHVPVESIAGERDLLIPTINAKIIADRIPNARLTLVPRAGHHFFDEHPGSLEAAISRVRRRVESSPTLAAAQ